MGLETGRRLSGKTRTIARDVVRCPNPRCALQQYRKPGPKQQCIHCAQVWNADAPQRRTAKC